MPASGNNHSQGVKCVCASFCFIASISYAQREGETISGERKDIDLENSWYFYQVS